MEVIIYKRIMQRKKKLPTKANIENKCQNWEGWAVDTLCKKGRIW